MENPMTRSASSLRKQVIAAVEKFKEGRDRTPNFLLRLYLDDKISEIETWLRRTEIPPPVRRFIRPF